MELCLFEVFTIPTNTSAVLFQNFTEGCTTFSYMSPLANTFLHAKIKVQLLEGRFRLGHLSSQYCGSINIRKKKSSLLKLWTRGIALMKKLPGRQNVSQKFQPQFSSPFWGRKNSFDFRCIQEGFTWGITHAGKQEQVSLFLAISATVMHSEESKNYRRCMGGPC